MYHGTVYGAVLRFAIWCGTGTGTVPWTPREQVCRVLAAVNSRNPISSAGKSKASGSRGTSNSSSATAKEKSNGNAAVSVDDKDPLKAFHSLFGLSPTEAKEVYRRGEAGAGAGGEGGARAVSRELDRRKAAYIRVVLTVAPSLGMTHANPGMQGEVRLLCCKVAYLLGFDCLAFAFALPCTLLCALPRAIPCLASTYLTPRAFVFAFD